MGTTSRCDAYDLTNTRYVSKTRRPPKAAFAVTQLFESVYFETRAWLCASASEFSHSSLPATPDLSHRRGDSMHRTCCIRHTVGSTASASCLCRDRLLAEGS
jgi:hypothetical protein